MTALFSVNEAKAFLESTKLDLTSIEDSLADQMALQVLPKLATVYDTSAWIDTASTPALVRSLIAMLYVAEVYDRTYSDNSDDTTSNYAFLLRRTVQANIAGLLNGSIVLPEFPDVSTGIDTPLFFPTDASSLANKGAGCEGSLGTLDDPANTDASFSMGLTF